MKNKYDVKRIIPDELSESLDIFLKNYSETGLSDIILISFMVLS